MKKNAYRGHRFPPAIIQVTVWMYARFTLSLRDVEELLAERGLDISYETVRRWLLRFGQVYARNIRHRRHRPTDRWYLDEMVIVMGRRRCYLWRAVDSEGEVLDFLVQRRRNTRAAERLMRKLLKRQGFAPSTIVTDNSARMVLRKRNLVCTRFMSKACGRIIDVRTPMCLSADASISNSASSPRDQHSAF